MIIGCFVRVNDPHYMATIEDAPHALSIPEILCMYIFPKCTPRAQAMCNCVCKHWNDLWFWKAWIPDVVRARQASERWWIATDIMRHNGYGFHNSMVQDWAEFLDGLRWLFRDEEDMWSKKRKREEAIQPGGQQKKIRLE